MRPAGETRSAVGPEVRDREERLRRLGQVTGELLHDLAGALAVLTGRVQLARAEASRGRVAADELARIGTDADELRAMVLDVLGEVRGERVSPEVTFPIRTTLEEVVTRWLVGAPRVSVSLHSSIPESASVAGPRTFFLRAVGNLLRNASRHARSEIRITARAASTGAAVEILVEDDGDGVPEEIRDRIFEPLVTGSRTGTGLGLSFARWGMERLGGRLELDQEPAALGGAGFRIVLPLSTIAARSRRSVPASTGAGPLRGVRVAIVDDDPAVRATTVRLFERAGSETKGLDPADWSTVRDGVDALVDFAPGVVLLDLSLGSHSAPDLARALGESAPALLDRTLYFTGDALPGPLDRPVVSKLLPWEELLERIRAEIPL